MAAAVAEATAGFGGGGGFHGGGFGGGVGFGGGGFGRRLHYGGGFGVAVECRFGGGGFAVHVEGGRAAAPLGTMLGGVPGDSADAAAWDVTEPAETGYGHFRGRRERLAFIRLAVLRRLR